MTRETKIGLLVGLAFIIVIGILLSDYNRNESQPAVLNAVAGDVQKGAATPHNGSTETAILPPTQPTPARPVLTHDELQQAQRDPVAAGNGHPATPHTPVTPVTQVPDHNGADPAHHGGTPALPPDLGRLVDEHPGDLTATDPSARQTPTQDPPRATQTVNGAKPYVAVSGDTVSKLAGRFLGSNTKANREAILAINPTLKSNPNNVTVGKTYMIPPKATAPSDAAPVRTVAAAGTPTPSNDQHYYYTVREKDSLWRIASDQLGDPNAVAALKELNKEILKGSETLHPNMRLRLPAKPVASAN